MTGPWRMVDGPAGVLRTYTTAMALGSAPGPVLVLCHEMPWPDHGASDLGRTYPALADRLAQESGFRVVAGMLRGAGGSDGDFSASGWLEDLDFVIGREVGPDGPVHLAGFGLGGAVALRKAAGDARVRAVAALGTPADLGTLVSDPDAVLAQCRRIGVVRTPGFPPDRRAWLEDLVALRPLEAAAALGGRPLLVVHGGDDGEVPAAAARALADAAIEGAASGDKGVSRGDEGAASGIEGAARAAAGAPPPVDLRIVPGAGHWLRADPRVVATLIGWVERLRW